MRLIARGARRDAVGTANDQAQPNMVIGNARTIVLPSGSPIARFSPRPTTGVVTDP